MIFDGYEVTLYCSLMIGVDSFFNSRSAQLATLATRLAVPTISAYQEFTAAGGLMSYGGAPWRHPSRRARTSVGSLRANSYVDRQQSL